jgi:hypothetical protein
MARPHFFHKPQERSGGAREVAMDKPRHPQVIRPWKTLQTQSSKWSAPPTAKRWQERSKKPSTPKRS